MAFPTIPTVAAGRVLTAVQADTSATRTFPNLSSLTKNSGDLLIALIAAYQSSTTNAQFGSWGAGFTEAHDSGASSSNAMGVAYKWSDGTETGTFTVTQSFTIVGHAVMILLSIPGAHASAAPQVGTRSSGTVANSTALTPSWGAADTLWIDFASMGETSTTGAFDGFTAAPTNYTDVVNTGLSADAVGGIVAACAFRQLNAATEDPGAWAGDSSNIRTGSFVIAVRPADAVAAVGANPLVVGQEAALVRSTTW